MPRPGLVLDVDSSTPPIVFVLLGVAVIGGIALLCQQVLSGECRRSRVWLAGFGLLLLARLLVLYLPYIRGYYSWMGDNSTHIGLAAEIVAKACGVTREAQDAFAVRSQDKAVAAQQSTRSTISIISSS